ncbi:MAG: zinc ABC transporter substrate-binding protein [Microbacterium sp.]|uniref:metal ABC transporter solute-binding protein, Zn/Mn family n=1 Tax=Microbacterium sp. TaxID=51671 RepID=UPI0039E6937C
MPRIRMTLALPAVSAAAVLALAGCAASSASDDASDGTFTLVTSTNVYGQIAQEIAGDDVTVTSIIDSASQDPHEFEATAADQLTVQSADLIVANGGGYDPFIDSLIDASGSEAPVIVAAEYSSAWQGEQADEDTTAELQSDPHAELDHDEDELEGFNEHVWYSFDTIASVAQAIADELSALLPDDASTFSANLDAFTSQLDSLTASTDEIAAAHQGEEVMYTEPVPGYLVEAAGLVNVMPEDFSEAVEEGNDVPAATLLEATTLLQSGEVSVLFANSQTGGAETTQLIDTADAAGVPVLEVSETLPDGLTYIEWMQQNVSALAAALDS